MIGGKLLGRRQGDVNWDIGKAYEDLSEVCNLKNLKLSMQKGKRMCDDGNYYSMAKKVVLS